MPKKKLNKNVITSSTTQKNSSYQGQQVQLNQFLARYSGPIPPPVVLKEYEEINPGLAEKIFLMAENEILHRQKLENEMLKADIAISNKILEINSKEVKRGQYLGFLIGTVAIAAGAITSIMGQPIPGTLLGTSGVVGLVTAFIIGKKDSELQSAYHIKDSTQKKSDNSCQEINKS